MPPGWRAITHENWGAARKARDLGQRTHEIMQKEQMLGSGSTFQTMAAQRDLAVAELDLATAMRATGSTLEHNGVLIQEAVTGTVTTSSP